MALDAEELARTTAGSFNVRLRYFAAGVAFTALADLDNFAVTKAPPAGWTVAGDSITPASPWVEISELVAHEGQWTQDLSGSAIRWTAELRGWNYDAGYLGPGMAVCCLWDMIHPAEETKPGWRLFWLGLVDAGGRSDDFRDGAAWERTIRGVDAGLEGTDAPRLTLGRIELAGDGTVVVSSTLATPASEAGNGEFIGSTMDVGSGNVNDGRESTVWIAQYPPSLVEETQAAGNGIVIDEVFNWPVAGYNRALVWWFELLHKGGSTLARGGRLYTRNSDGDIACIEIPDEIALADDERMIVCADKRRFEDYTGGSAAARRVLETKSIGSVAVDSSGNPVPATYRLFDLHPADGFLILSYGLYYTEDIVVWGSPTLPAWLPMEQDDPYVVEWGTVGDRSGVAVPSAGSSIRRSPAGTDTDLKADWVAESHPRPGDKWQADDPEWVQLELDAHTSTLGGSVIGPAELLIDEGTLGWYPSGTGLVGEDYFTYTGRLSDRLTGVSGVGVQTKGEPLYPTASGVQQEGWPAEELRLVRLRGLPVLKRGRVYLSEDPDCRNPGETGWESDYEPPINFLTWTPAPPLEPMSTLRFDLSLRLNKHLRTVLLVIDQMGIQSGTTDSRAKLNELEIDADGAASAGVFEPALESRKAAAAIEHLMSEYSWMGDGGGSVVDETADGWGLVGTMALAIAPLPRVLDEIAEMHGCVISYEPNGQLRVVEDPWWPGGAKGAYREYEFTEASIRGELRREDGRPAVSGVAVSAMDGDGRALERVVAPPGATGSNVREVSGFTVAGQGAAVDLAWQLYLKETNTERARWMVKGIGDWCRCGQRVALAWNWVLDSLPPEYLIERVSYTWGPARWTCRVEARRYQFGGAVYYAE